jgi:hypothetical protein
MDGKSGFRTPSFDVGYRDDFHTSDIGHIPRDIINEKNDPPSENLYKINHYPKRMKNIGLIHLS